MLSKVYIIFNKAQINKQLGPLMLILYNKLSLIRNSTFKQI
jgi:hypothetical protein